MKKFNSVSLALAVVALFGLHVSSAFAQQYPEGSRKPACGCYVCGKLIAVNFDDKDCAGILAESACGGRMASLPNTQRESFCQKVKTQVRFTSFKDSCPVLAPHCGPER